MAFNHCTFHFHSSCCGWHLVLCKKNKKQKKPWAFAGMEACNSDKVSPTQEIIYSSLNMSGEERGVRRQNSFHQLHSTNGTIKTSAAVQTFHWKLRQNKPGQLLNRDRYWNCANSVCGNVLCQLHISSNQEIRQFLCVRGYFTNT